ncbi:chemotaxis protein [Sphingomonas gei]|uniref:Chemotaxis protein n=2 Tax=Sphingomonas gei TaxID=1395960 RepID=A0A4S1XEA7_9SPHN|nr:chemotaxis protein [Sphingomonas gei]
MHWFQAVAPIRLKLVIAFNSLLGAMVAIALVALIAPLMIALPIVAILITGAAVQCARYRKAIADPYVSTVVRMEGLAAGDLAAPIQFTDYQDCVGRMTKAMLSFRDAAVVQQRLAQEQDEAVQRLGSQLERLSEGDLTAEIGEGFPDSYAVLRTNYNAALGSLRGLIGSVTESASAIHTGSGEIAQASEDLARRTETNAASLEQTAAAVTQMDQRLKATAQAANRTVGRADGAIATVSGGRSIADEAVQAMTRVADSAKGIDSVIEGLDKIAFQTRVLAMNAAVEAGRAGEAGRGFAVVADLVSALAMRAEEEAGRARDQLTATQTDIVAAVEMVQKVDGALADISGDVGEVHALLGGIAADNEAQSTAITQISVAIGTMDQATQQNAAMVEQTSAAARSLSGEVAALGEQAARFNIGSEGGSARPRPSARPARAATKSAGYVSPVKALPAAAKAGAGSDAWASF